MSEFLADLQGHFGDGYLIERELGGGGMSRVILARDVRLDRRVVIKLLPPSVTATISVERFEREIMLAAGLQHPNIVPVLSAGDFGSLPYFIMPFIDGESLRARMLRGPLSVRETVSVLKDVSRALSFAHARGIIHRDIKPDNVLLSAGAAVVTDFGVAKALSASRQSGARFASPTITGMGTSLGTPAYMAPEQAAADPSLDHRADLYALGIVAYEMLVGAPPFHGRTPQALLAAQLSEAPAPLNTRRYDVPLPLSELIMHCLEKEPANRPKTANDVLRALEDPGTASDGFTAVARPVDRRARLRTGIIALIVATASGTGFWLYRSAGERGVLEPVASVVTEPPRAIAVLPLTSIGRDAQSMEAAQGMTAQLTTAIARVAGVRVASQTAAAAVRDSARSPSEIGRLLNVELLLEGTVQRERDRLRVTLRLVNAANDSTEWAQTFDGTISEAFALQDSTARIVSAAVAVHAGGALRPRGQ